MRYVLILLSATILFGRGDVVGQDKKQPAKKGKDIDITAPKIPQKSDDVPFPSDDVPPPSPTDATAGLRNLAIGNLGFNGPGSTFDFSGSPFGQFDYSTGILTGPPIPIFDLNRSVTTLDPMRIDQQAAGTTPELFENIPGVFIQRTNGGGGSAIIRGRNGNENVVLIDGVPINDAGWRFGNVQYLNTIDEGIIDRIEVIRGPASVLFGSGATGGVINIITKRRQNYEESFDMDAGFITRFSSATNGMYGNVSVQGNLQNFGYYTAGSYLGTGALDAGDGAFFPNAIAGYDQSAAFIRTDAFLANDWILTFNYQHLTQPRVPRTDRFPDPDVNPFDFRNRPTFFDPQRRNFAYARLSRFNENDFITGIVATLSFQERTEGREETRLDRDDLRQRFSEEQVLSGGVDLRAYTVFNENHSLIYGMTYYRDDVDANRLQRTIDSPMLKRITPTLPDDGKYAQFGIFLLDRIQLTEWFALTGGVRWSYITADGTANAMSDDEMAFTRHFSDWSAEGGAVVALTDNLHWNVTIAEGFRAPNLDDLAAADVSTSRGQDIGTTTLSTERGVNYETGFRFLGDLMAGEVTYYYMDFESLIVRTPAGDGVNARTNSDGFIHGVELAGYCRFTDNLGMFASGSYIFGQDTELNEPLSRIPPAFLATGLRWNQRLPRCLLFSECWVEMASKQDRLSAADRGDIRIPAGGTPAWQTVNLRAGIDHPYYGRFILGVYNILDENYRYHGSGIDAPGAELRLGYELIFGRRNVGVLQ